MGSHYVEGESFLPTFQRDNFSARNPKLSFYKNRLFDLFQTCVRYFTMRFLKLFDGALPLKEIYDSFLERVVHHEEIRGTGLSPRPTTVIGRNFHDFIAKIAGF